MSNARSGSELFSSVDAAWLHMDTPSNLAVITGVISFERKLNYERLVATVTARLLVHKRFRQRVREPDGPFGLPRWEYDPDFDLDYHLQQLALPEPGGHAELQELAGDLMSEPLDLARPLWQFHYVDNYLDGSALICRLHHCIADGLALVQVLLAATDVDADAPWPDAPDPSKPKGDRPPRIVQAAKAVEGAFRTAGSLAQGGKDLLVNPSKVIEMARLGKKTTRALGKLLLIGPDRKTAFRGKCDIPKRVAWTKAIKLQDVKDIGRLMGGTINDILISAVTGALRRYLEDQGEVVYGLNIRAIVPVNLRQPGEVELMGNRFGLVFLSLPLGIEDPIKRLIVLKRRMDEIKDSPEAIVAFGILGAMGMSPTQIENIIVAIFGMKGTAVMTNVPGPRQPLYFAGGKIDNLMFWVPTPGNLGLGVSIVSYAGDVILGVATDAGLVPDPEAILDNFYDEMEYLKRWGRPPGQLQRKQQAEAPPKVAQTEAQEESETAVELKCQARTKAGKPCKNRARPGYRTCHIHRAQEQ